MDLMDEMVLMDGMRGPQGPAVAKAMADKAAVDPPSRRATAKQGARGPDLGIPFSFALICRL